MAGPDGRILILGAGHGLPLDAKRTIVRGEPCTARAVFRRNADDQAQTAEAIDAATEFTVGPQLITSRKRVQPAKLGDIPSP